MSTGTLATMGPASSPSALGGSGHKEGIAFEDLSSLEELLNKDTLTPSDVGLATTKLRILALGEARRLRFLAQRAEERSAIMEGLLTRLRAAGEQFTATGQLEGRSMEGILVDDNSSRDDSGEGKGVGMAKARWLHRVAERGTDEQ